jgi:hypothetical protein
MENSNYSLEGAETQTRLGPMHGALTIWWDSVEEQENNIE